LVVASPFTFAWFGAVEKDEGSDDGRLNDDKDAFTPRAKKVKHQTNKHTQKKS
jgi:hypothetical protein